MEMEMEMEVLIREGFRKRGGPDSQLEITSFGESYQKFWDELMKGHGVRPMRRDSEHAEAKTSWMKLDLDAERRAASCSSEDEDDEPGFDLGRFRRRWIDLWSGANLNGDFEDTTLIPPMRYTDEPPCHALGTCCTLQIFSVKVAGIGEGRQWPLDVFGMVAIRDTIDENRNIIFQRSSLNCQTLTEKAITSSLATYLVYLSLFISIEVDLKAKGTYEDKTLFCRVLPFRATGAYYSRLLQLTNISKFSTLEFTVAHINFSLEATVFVRVIDGSWPYGFHGEFGACASVDGMGPVVSGTSSVDQKELVLLSFGPGKEPMAGDGKIELSCRVVSVQQSNKLEVFVKAWYGDRSIVDRASFTTKESGRSYGKLEVASCKMEVTVAWSFISSIPELHRDMILKNNRCSS